MPGLYQSEKKNMGELLSSRLIMPPNQRKFSWEFSEIETFWQDIVSFSDRNAGETYRAQEYFLGSIVVIDPPGAIERQILDGQQRLATATILLAVIRDVLIELGFRDPAVTLQDRYIASHDDLRDTNFHHLELSQYDQEFFAREIQQRRDVDPYTEPTPRLLSHRLIRSARNFFLGSIRQGINQLPT